MTAVSFGIFDHLDRREAPLAQTFEERLQLLDAADAAGFRTYHLAEHHQTPLSIAPSPAVFLAAASQRTRRLRFGPLVYLLPMYNPLRLIEEICMLDQLSGGRFELGVGRGISPYELAYHGVDPERSREQFHEALEVITAGMSTDRLSFKGQFYRYDRVPIEVWPAQRPYPPIWYPTTSEDGLRFAGRHGLNVVLAGRADGVAAQAAIYRESWQAHEHEPGRLNGHVPEPMVGANYKLYVAETDEAALEVARPAQRAHHNALVKLWHDFGAEPIGRGFTDDIDLMIGRGTALVGSPARVREQVAAYFEQSGCNYLVVQIHFGCMTHEQALRSLRLFAEEVMPAFAAPPAAAAAS
ncbi:MAG TPA: LLM class flavin-dependent oxidoreductase [Dehalococcoidia bacterium]|nr:LLM class flavin-dependent oxidoreductase [Dehalococcoidia bacterium]